MTKRKVSLGQVVLGERELELLTEVVHSSRLSYGPKTRELERHLADLHGVEHAVFLASGTCALQVGLEALKEIRGWPDDSEVIIPATTFIATMSSVIHAGLKPVLVDIEDQTFGIDFDRIKDSLPQAACFLLVHLLGMPSLNVKAMAQFTNDDFPDRNIDLVEDCCEAVGVTRDGKPVGSFGTFSVISTYACHHLSTGIGGAVLTGDDELAMICRSIVQHGRDPAYLSLDDVGGDVVDKRYSFVRWGHSYRATEMEAALGLAQIDHLGTASSERARIASLLTDRLQSQRLTLPAFSEGSAPLFYPIVVPGGCGGLVRHLEEHGIETRPLMPLLNQGPVCEYLKSDVENPAEQFPVAWRLIDEGFIVGCHPGMTVEDVDHIAECVDGFFGASIC